MKATRATVALDHEDAYVLGLEGNSYPQCGEDSGALLETKLVSPALSFFSKCGMLGYAKNWTAQAGVGVE